MPVIADVCFWLAVIGQKRASNEAEGKSGSGWTESFAIQDLIGSNCQCLSLNASVHERQLHPVNLSFVCKQLMALL